MILSTGQRTDIPAFYAEWFANRLKAGEVYVRSPYQEHTVYRYTLDPSVVDCIGFCTKNPEPMFPYMNLLQEYGQFWYVTITPYGNDLEPRVPDKHHMLEVFKTLSGYVGIPAIGWRYDPILLTEKYTPEYHLRAFQTMAEALEGYTDNVVISFVDRYQKVRRNFPELKDVPHAVQRDIGVEIVSIAHEHGMIVRPCAEGDWLEPYGADCSGCMTIPMFERAIGEHLDVPHQTKGRKECACFLSNDIGAYDTCPHLCKYCYANNDPKRVAENNRAHDPESPFLVGNFEEGDRIIDRSQKSWISGQMRFF